MKNEELKKYISKEFYSPYFKCNIIVVSIIDDDNWIFKLVGENILRKAQTKLSYFINNSMHSN